jgi:aminomethyltransferase
MGLQTPLFAEHERLKARIVPFGGWDMPLHYGSQIEEHHAVRRDAGLFDVSHMRVVDLAGPAAQAFLRGLLANDVARLKARGKALYSCMLNPQGGVIDDLIVYLRDEPPKEPGAPTRYRLVVNAGTADKDLAWLRTQAEGRDLTIEPRTDLAMIAVQGPQARAKAAAVIPADLREAALALAPFCSTEGGDWFVGRTGYTGEDGFELMLPADQAPRVLRALVEAGVRPCGLGARDTLRLEAGMNLYGQDMDENVSPLESGLAWTVAFDPPGRGFIGRAVLDAQRGDAQHASPRLRRFVGLLLEGRGVLRSHQKVYADGREVGEITSGGFAPTLGRSIAFTRITPDAGPELTVDIRGRMEPVRVVKTTFVRNGQPVE